MLELAAGVGGGDCRCLDARQPPRASPWPTATFPFLGRHLFGDPAVPSAPLLSASRAEQSGSCLLPTASCCLCFSFFAVGRPGESSVRLHGAATNSSGSQCHCSRAWSGSPCWELVLGRSPQEPLPPFLFLLLSLSLSLPPPSSWWVSAKPCGLVLGCELIKGGYSDSLAKMTPGRFQLRCGVGREGGPKHPAL